MKVRLWKIAGFDGYTIDSNGDIKYFSKVAPKNIKNMDEKELESEDEENEEVEIPENDEVGEDDDTPPEDDDDDEDIE